MTWLTVYLAGYFTLLAGAAWSLWESGILAETPGFWIGAAAVAAVWPAVMLALVSGRPATPTRS